MHRIGKYLISAGCCIFLILSSCDRNPVQDQSPYGDTIVAKEVVVIDELSGIKSYRMDGIGSNFIFEISRSFDESIQIGDLIVGTEFGGYLRRVTRVTRYPEQLILETAPADLDEGIVKGYIDTTIYFDIGAQTAGSEKMNLIKSDKAVSLSEDGIVLSELQLYSGNTDGVEALIEITDGAITFDPVVNFGIGISSTGFKEFFTYIKGNLDFDYDAVITTNGKFELNGLKNVATFEKSTVQKFGRLPIVEVVTLEFDIAYEVSVVMNGTMKCGTNANYELNAGTKYKDGEWSSRWDNKANFAERPMSWPGRGTTKVKITLRPRISVDFFSVTASRLTFLPYMNFDGEVAAFPSWCWQMSNGIQGSHGFQMSVFGYSQPNSTINYESFDWPMSDDCETIDDITAPSPIVDLLAGGPTYKSIELSWIAPGDDAETGKAAIYDVRYSKVPIDESNWDMATKVETLPNPQYSGSPEELTVYKLAPITTYYFAVKVGDEIPNWSGLSNIATETTLEAPDLTPPNRISDLVADNPTQNSITLTWTAPGDDDIVGTATKYDIRLSTEIITNSVWANSASIQYVPNPKPSGQKEEFVVTNLVPNTAYFFAMKAVDESSNWSDKSNVAGIATLPESQRGKIVGTFDSHIQSNALDLAGGISSLWVIDQISDTLFNINLNGGAIDKKLVFAPAGTEDLRGITWDGINLWVATRTRIYRVDADNGDALESFAYNGTLEILTGMSWDNGTLWIAGPSSDKTYQINITQALTDGNISNSIISQLPFLESSNFRGIVAFDDKLYISISTNSEMAQVYEYDAVSSELLDQFKIQETYPYLHNPIQGGLATDGTYLYVGADNHRILITILFDDAVK